MFARKWRSISKFQPIAIGGGNFPQAIVSKRHKFDKREAVKKELKTACICYTNE